MGMLPNILARRPHVAEQDFAGVVVDANGTEFENGQEVFGIAFTGALLILFHITN